MLSIRDLVENGKILGSGAFGEVREGVYCGVPVAIKKFHDPNMMDGFKAEVDILKEMNHPNLVTMLAFDSKMMVLEKYDSDATSLTDYIDVVTVARDCMRGIYYMHMHGNCMKHGDIKPENILVKRDINGKIRQAALGDMGLSRSCTTGGYTGTPGYMPIITHGVDRMHDVVALAVSLLDASTTHHVHTSTRQYEQLSEYPPPGNSIASEDNTMFFAKAMASGVRIPISQMLSLIYNPGRDENDKRAVVIGVLGEWEEIFEYITENIKDNPINAIMFDFNNDETSNPGGKPRERNTPSHTVALTPQNDKGRSNENGFFGQMDTSMSL